MVSKEIKDWGWKILEVILVFLAVVFSAVFINQTQEGSNFIATIVVGLILFLIIWAYPNEHVKGIKKRMNTYKTFLNRWGLTALIVLIFAFSVPTMAHNLKVAKTPTPEISITNKIRYDGKIYIGTWYSFEVKLKVADADSVKINDKEIEPIEWEYIFTWNVITGWLYYQIKIYASNEYKNATKEIEIMRDLNEQEKAEAQAKIEKEKAEQEALVAQQKKEAELAEKKAKQEQAKKAQEKSRIEAKYERLMKSGYYLYELEWKLFDLGFEQTSQWYGDAPDGSTQIITYYAKDEWAFRVVISLQNGYALWKYWYTVEAKEY